MRFLLLSVAILLFSQGISAFFCEIFNTCSTTTAALPPSATPSATPPTESSSIIAPIVNATVSVPTPTSITTQSSIITSAKPTSIISSAAPTSLSISTTFSSSIIPSSTTLLDSTPSVTPSATPEPEKKSSGSNIGVIVGSVCGFIAIVGAGFAYAFFSKTRRNNRDKRPFSHPENSYANNSGYQDPYSRPSPAVVASAAAAADTIHNHNQWDNSGSYNNYAPQPPMAAVAKQHDSYYSTPPVSQMGYSTPDPYYNHNQQQYYDPNAVYYDQQQQQHHYDPLYVDSQKQQSDQYVQQHQSPVLSNNNPTIYSVPHSYSNDTANHR